MVQTLRPSDRRWCRLNQAFTLRIRNMGSMSDIEMLRQQPLNSDSASVEWMEVAHEDDDVPIIGWAL